MKILVVGDFHSKIHENALADAFASLGCDVERFSWWQYFKGYCGGEGAKNNLAESFYYRAQNKLIFGPVIRKINKDLLRAVDAGAPDLIFIYRGTHIFPETVQKIKEKKICVFGYNNDDPFSPQYPAYVWRHFMQSIPFYDHIFLYRHKNIEDYKKMGCRRVSLLRSYYIKQFNFPIQDFAGRQYESDVVFAGHYENDGRDDYIKKIIDAGIDIQLYGPEWHRSRHYQFFKKYFKRDIVSIPLGKYNEVLNGTKIALVFLSSLNNDTYTRRVFEIVAAKTFMLCQRTDDMQTLFAEGKEAAYFSTAEELLEKIRYCLSHKSERNAIAQAGHARLLQDGHEVIDRAKEIINVFEKTTHKA